MKTPSNDLFELVHSLNPSEKRYVRLYAQRHFIGESNNNLELFDFIASQKEPDDKALSKHFAKNPIGTKPATYKNHLYYLIIKALNEFYAKSSVRAEIRSLLNAVDWLHGKMLYRQCEKLLWKAYALAEESENTLALLEIEIWLLETNFDLQNLQAISQFASDENPVFKHVETVKSMFQLRQITSQLAVIGSRSGDVRSEKELALFEQILAHPVLDESRADLSDREFIFIHSIKGFVYSRMVDNARSLFYRKALVDFYLENSRYIEDRPKAFLTSVTNLLISAGLEDNLFLFERYAPVPMHFPIELSADKKRQMEFEYFSRIYNIRLDAYIRKKQFDKALAILPAVEQGLEDYGKKLADVHLLSYSIDIAKVYFFTGSYNQALTFILNAMQIGTGELRVDIQLQARIMNVLIHYELENVDLLEHLLVATSRFIKKLKTVTLYEQWMLSVLKMLVNNSPMEAGKYVKSKYQNLLEEITTLPQERKALEGFDLLYWIESRKIKRAL